MNVTVPSWNPVTREWDSVTVDAPPISEPAKAVRPRAGQPRDLSDVARATPLAFWRRTGYAEATGEAGWADMRTYLPAPAIKTHRAAVNVPASPETYAPPSQDGRRARQTFTRPAG